MMPIAPISRIIETGWSPLVPIAEPSDLDRVLRSIDSALPFVALLLAVALVSFALDRIAEQLARANQIAIDEWRADYLEHRLQKAKPKRRHQPHLAPRTRRDVG